jgi:hypothetical protein
MAPVVGRLRLTGAEHFWYVLQSIAFGAGYFAKVPVKKALSEVTQRPVPRNAHLRPEQDALPHFDEAYRPAVPPDQRYLPPGRHGPGMVALDESERSARYRVPRSWGSCP